MTQNVREHNFYQTYIIFFKMLTQINLLNIHFLYKEISFMKIFIILKNYFYYLTNENFKLSKLIEIVFKGFISKFEDLYK